MPSLSNWKFARRKALQIAAAILAFGFIGAGLACAQDSTAVQGKIYVISHVDLVPPQAAAGIKLLQQYAVDSRKDKGAVRIEILDQISRPNHFSIVEVWESQAAFDAHVAAAHTVQFRHQIDPMLGSPYDERPHKSAE